MVYKMSIAKHCVLMVCDVASRVIGYRRFERAYCLHLQESVCSRRLADSWRRRRIWLYRNAMPHLTGMEAM